MGWFSPTPPVDAEEFEWLIATAKWIGLHERALGAGAQPRLILPTSEFFSTAPGPGPAAAQALFDTVRRHAGMAAWPCDLLPADAVEPRERAHALEIRDGSTAQPLGTFSRSVDERPPVIRYRPDLWRNPDMLIATFAHELAHYRMQAYGDLPPGGAELEELATDMLGVHMGFGIFLANTAKTFSAFTAYDVQGWKTQRVGYLSEHGLITALAMTERLAGRDPTAGAGRYLKSYLRADLKRASRHLAATCPDLLASIESADLADFA